MRSVLLLKDGTFEEIWALWLKSRFEQEYDLKFTYFERASELVKLTQERGFDLILLYYLNVKWDVPGLEPLDLLASLKHGKRILVTQGMDLTEQCERAGVSFLELPCTPEQLHAALQDCLNAPPPALPA